MYRSQILSPFLGSDSELKMGSENGRICGRFGSSLVPAFAPAWAVLKPPRGQAFASWRWCNYLMSKVPAGNKALMNNMDEAAIQLFLD